MGVSVSGDAQTQRVHAGESLAGRCSVGRGDWHSPSGPVSRFVSLHEGHRALPGGRGKGACEAEGLDP